MTPSNARLNRLAGESSLYLRQHATNPVDWFPWGEEALAQSRTTGRPIFLSIGYSACHWCHVMEHESFENEATAKILNDHFVCIKVDREERPDIDTIYMSALQMMSREGGGWPLSVFLTPTLKPFYAGTYFPPDNRYAPQRPAFPQLLQAILEAWTERREAIEKSADEVTDSLRQISERDFGRESDLNPSLIEQAVSSLERVFDPRNGGFGSAPKFPHALELRLLLRAWKRLDSAPARSMTRFTLQQMARGGMYDQIGGGFSRYSVDARWLVPHFEKMLYDNALLATTYAESYRAHRDPFDRQIVTETLDYVLREMTSEPGGFYSAQDADSEGEEGKFYVWSESEIESILGDDLAPLAKAVWGVTAHGNFEKHNILFRKATDADEAAALGMSVEVFRDRLSQAKRLLMAVRSQRIWPGRDEKILTAWNGLMIIAFAEAAVSLDEPRYLVAAQKAADFVLATLRDADGRLLRTTAVGMPAKLNGYLEDYAFMINALVSLYQADFQTRWLQAAVEIADRMVARFSDPTGGGFFFTPDDHEQLITRTKDIHDGSTPSGNAMAVTGLLKLAVLTARQDLYEIATKTLESFAGLMVESPAAAGQMLIALDFHLGPVREIVIIGERDQPETIAVLKLLHERYAPNDMLVFHDPRTGDAPITLLPLLEDRTMRDGKVTAYICQNYTCQAPVMGLEAIREAIG